MYAKELVRILFLSAWFPFPPDNGSKIRVYNLLRALRQRHQVTLLTFADANQKPGPADSPEWCHIAGTVPKMAFVPHRPRAIAGLLSPVPRSVVDTYSPAMAQLVQQELTSNQYDLIVASQWGTAVYVTQLRIPALFEEVELGVFRDAYVCATGRAARVRHWLTWEKLRRYLRRVARRFDACTVVSKQEKELLLGQVSDSKHVEIIPNGVAVQDMHVEGVTPNPNVLAFSGALTYSANYDAAHYFLSEMWPQIKSAQPEVSLKITGRTDGVDLRHLPLGNGAALTGYVPDIRPVVAGAWGCIVPLRVGGGTRVKILEAMALGTPVITTPKGAEGLDVTHDENILIATHPVEFAAQTLRLLRDPALRQRLAANGRHLVQDKYDWCVIGNQFNRLIESVACKGSVRDGN